MHGTTNVRPNVVATRGRSRRPSTRSSSATSVLALCLLISGLLGIFSYDSARAQAALTPTMALERLLTTDELDPQWFTDEMLAAVSAQEVQLIIEQLTGGLGALQRIQQLQPPRFEIFFEGGVLPAQIMLNDQGRIEGLFFEPPRPRVSGFDDVVATFAALPGETSVLVLADGLPLVAHNSARPLAVGSTFKLAVLAALLMDVEQGLLAWDDIVTLDDGWRSLPSGVLQDWPAGAPLTLHTLTANMISISDNTATDALIQIVGRDKVGVFTPRNEPFLTTRELFILKNPANAAVLEEYRAGDAVERHALLARSQQLPLIEATVLRQPTVPDVEWFFTTEETCGLMAMVQHVPLMSINPGVVEPAQWEHVAFKGGSEPGVLNLTTWLVSESGTSYCASATWNDVNSLDESRYIGLYSGLLDVIQQVDSAQD